MVDEQSGFDKALKEYKLVVQTQMHFNEILMKFRSFGIAVVIAVYSYAITRKDLGISFVGGLSPVQLLACAGMALTFVLAAIDLGYFFPLLLGAVERSIELEKHVPYRLTSTISKRVSERRSYFFIIVFYGVIALAGVGIIVLGLPQVTLHQQHVTVSAPVEVKVESANIQLNATKETVSPRSYSKGSAKRMNNK